MVWKAADDFEKVLYGKIHKLAKTPYAGSRVRKNKGVRKISITKYNKIYYRIKGNIITVLAIFETRQNPEKNKYE